MLSTDLDYLVSVEEVKMSVCPSVRPSLCLFVCLSVCNDLCVCFYVDNAEYGPGLSSVCGGGEDASVKSIISS